ncbi:MAG: methyltransferase domain-containing protein [Candidatus Omnitrophica bacterium]|nr:methyltransferase domain-containing protein [Candidatus Omnitrophota bacterium]
MASKVQYEVGMQFPSSVVAGELIRSLLAGCGLDISSLVEATGKGVTRYSFYIPGLKSAERAAARIRALRLDGVRLYLKKHRESDWLSGWKKGWRPFTLTKRFQVVPLWQADRSVPAGKEPIFIETTNAFGTGLHETTRFVAEVIEGMAGKFDSFLDVGTGTGILTVVALKCGAGHAAAFDNDPAAVRVARDNLRANHLSCRVTVADVRRYKVRRPFDLVAANLVSPDLVEFRHRLVSFVKAGGTLVISGISLKNIPRVKKAFSLPELSLVKVVRGTEWAAVSYRVQSGR